MNVFVLTTGRAGSESFVTACSFITNYTSAHESQGPRLGPGRVEFPDQHIEADNRLAWFLGRLGERYGDDAFYVHLIRERSATAASLVRVGMPLDYDVAREGVINSHPFRSRGIMDAYEHGIYMHRRADPRDPMEVAGDFYDTVNANIREFLAHRSRVMTFHLEQAEDDFVRFWEAIGAEGDLDAARKVWRTPTHTGPHLAAIRGAERRARQRRFGARPRGWLRRLARRVGVGATNRTPDGDPAD